MNKINNSLHIPKYYSLLYHLYILLLISSMTFIIVIPILGYKPIQQFIFNPTGKDLLLEKNWVVSMLAVVNIFLFMGIWGLLISFFHKNFLSKDFRKYADSRSHAVSILELESGWVSSKQLNKLHSELLRETNEEELVQTSNTRGKLLLTIISVIGILSFFITLCDYVRFNENYIGIRSMLIINEEKIEYDKIERVTLSYEKLDPTFIPDLSIYLKSGDKIRIWGVNELVSLNQGLKLIDIFNVKNVKIEFKEVPLEYIPNAESENKYNTYQSLINKLQKINY